MGWEWEGARPLLGLGKRAWGSCTRVHSHGGSNKHKGGHPQGFESPKALGPLLSTMEADKHQMNMQGPRPFQHGLLSKGWKGARAEQAAGIIPT